MEIKLDIVFEGLKKNYREYFATLPENTHYVIFDQTWSNSGLGLNIDNLAVFDAFTKAPTIVIFRDEKNADIFFGSVYAYSGRIDNVFFNFQINNRQMESEKYAMRREGIFKYELLEELRSEQLNKRNKNKE